MPKANLFKVWLFACYFVNKLCFFYFVFVLHVTFFPFLFYVDLVDVRFFYVKS